MAFIGWFLLTAAKATYAQNELTERLRGISVGDIMIRDCPVLDSRNNLQTFVEDYLLKTGQRCFTAVFTCMKSFELRFGSMFSGLYPGRTHLNFLKTGGLAPL